MYNVNEKLNSWKYFLSRKNRIIFFFYSQPQQFDPVYNCSQYICLNMEWTLYNWSLHCPKDLEMPDCGFRGRPVQVNTDICCPEWECPCMFAWQSIFNWGRLLYFWTDYVTYQARVIIALSSLNSWFFFPVCNFQSCFLTNIITKI